MQITAVGNIGQKAGYNVRQWSKHGKLPWIEYGVDSSKNSEIIINGKSYPIDRILVGGANYFAVRELIGVLNQAGVCNLQISNKGNIAVLTKK